MKKVAKFDKVSFRRFFEDIKSTLGEELPENTVKEIYDEIRIPKRATCGSAGYDFVSTITTTLEPGDSIKIPTGIRCYMDKGWVLKIYPRSGMGFKYHFRVSNTVGIIDSDYYYSDNEGHIFIKVRNEGDETVHLNRGNAFVQGVFVEYGITIDDKSTDVRNGGFGSTERMDV